MVRTGSLEGENGVPCGENGVHRKVKTEYFGDKNGVPWRARNGLFAVVRTEYLAGERSTLYVVRTEYLEGGENGVIPSSGW